MKTINCEALSPAELQGYLQAAIAPRPICLASTIDAGGNVNLSPFSFFNLFGTNPPMCIFSPARRIRDNTIKHTLENVMEVAECVINVVDYAMVLQSSLSSTEYPKGTSEFEKAGLTMLDSVRVRPPRVAESPVQLECLVKKIIPLGYGPGAGNLVLAEVKVIHVNQRVLDEQGRIDQQKMDLVARCGGDWYARVGPKNLFRVEKPLASQGIGVDALPRSVRYSRVLTGNELGILGNHPRMPLEVEVRSMHAVLVMERTLDGHAQLDQGRVDKLHLLARQFISLGEIEQALQILMIESLWPVGAAT